MNYRPTPATVSDDHARSVTSRMFAPGTAVALDNSGRAPGGRATLCCEKNCTCSAPEILRNGVMAGFLGNLSDFDVEPTMYDPGDTLTSPDFSFGMPDNFLIPINLTSGGPTFEPTTYDPASVLSPPNFISPSPNRPLQLQAPSSIPGAVASAVNSASQLIRTATTPTTRALVPASALTPSSVGTQLQNLISAQSIMPGISNGLLFMLVAGAALALNASSGKRR